MMFRGKVITSFIMFFVILCVVAFALPENSHSGIAQVPGCCTNMNTNPESCVGCVGCSTSPEYCANNGGTNLIAGLTCALNLSEEAVCVPLSPDTVGCCITIRGNCVDSVEFDECFDNLNGEIWDSANIQGSCDEVPQCFVPTRNVPALGEWGLIALALTLGVIGFVMVMRRRQAAV